MDLVSTGGNHVWYIYSLHVVELLISILHGISYYVRSRSSSCRDHTAVSSIRRVHSVGGTATETYYISTGTSLPLLLRGVDYTSPS